MVPGAVGGAQLGAEPTGFEVGAGELAQQGIAHVERILGELMAGRLPGLSVDLRAQRRQLPGPGTDRVGGGGHASSVRGVRTLSVRHRTLAEIYSIASNRERTSP